MNTTPQPANKLMASSGLQGTPIATSKQTQFNRGKLFSPALFWTIHGIKSNNDWIIAKSIFSDNHHPSWNINTITGSSCCHACGATGDDVLSAHQFFGGDFVSAAKALGQWEKK